MKYVASSKSQMTDYDKYYVYTGHEEGMITGCWYFWSGTEWLIGGDYQCGIDDIIETSSTMDEEGMPADAKAVGDMIVVSNTEPTSPHTELWIDPDTESVLVPTMDDIEGTYAKKSEVESTYARKAAVGSPLRAATASAMTDVTKIYVYTGSESGYASGHWYYYNGSSWADGGVYNSTAFVTDKTLTGDGEAADAKVTGDEITDLKSALNYGKTATQGYILTASNEGHGSVWSTVGLPTDEQTGQAVSDWLNDHPEVTTTVQNRSITEAKLADALKLKTIKDYVTPEMFGAVGDGVADDSQAIQDALLYCSENNVNRVHFPEGTYAVQPKVFQDSSVVPFFNGLMLTGEGKYASQIKLLTNNTECWLYDSTDDETFPRITFVDLGFFADDPTYGNGFLLYSTGMEKQLRFTRCQFIFGTIAKFTGTGNADLNHFIQCGFEAHKTAFILDNPQSVSTDFVASGAYCTSHLLEVINGGCISFFGGNFDCYGNSSSAVVYFPNGGNQGIANLGINFIGTRFELHNKHRLIICETEQVDSGKIAFTDCNIGRADSLSSGQYHVMLSGNKRLDFVNCALSSSLKYHAISNFSVTSGLCAVINFENCISQHVIWKNCSVEGNSARIRGNGNSVLSQGENYSANDFDMNIKARVNQQIQPTVKIYNVLREGSGFPKSGAYMDFDLPTGCYIKRIHLHRNAVSGASTSYQLHIGTSDENTVYGETALGTFRDEQIINVNDVGFISEETVRLWATGETTSIATGGICYIEYI